LTGRERKKLPSDKSVAERQDKGCLLVQALTAYVYSEVDVDISYHNYTHEVFWEAVIFVSQFIQ